MTKTSLVILMAAVMAVGVLGTNFVSDADALRSQNGASESTDICGLTLCSDYPGGKTAYQDSWFIVFGGSTSVSVNDHSDAHSEKHGTAKIPTSHNADQEFAAQLDTFIHKFELDKISAAQALEGIKEVHLAHVNARITSDIIDGVGDKLKLYNKGTFDAATAVESIHLTAEPQNVDPEYQGALDEVIHKFELDKISTAQALDGIKEAHYGFVDLYITSEIIRDVEDKITLIDSGKLSGADAVESIHLTAEPQNVDPEYQGALDEVIHKFELDKISADQALDGIKEAHYSFVDLYITSEIIRDVEDKITLIDSGKLSGADAVESIHLTAEPQNVDPEYQGALDEVIHKFELDKISADQALDGIKEAHYSFVDLYITSEIIRDVEDKITLIDSGKLSGADAVEAIHLTAEPQNVDPEYQGALDEVIHKFELDKISAAQALDGIKEAHYGFVDLYITSEIIRDVEDKITLIDSGKLSGADAVESIHLTAEPQNVNPELIGAVDEYLHKFELDKISADQTINGVIEAHGGFVDLYVTSNLVESIGIQLNIYESGTDSASHVLHEIHKVIEEEEAAMAALLLVDGKVVVKELPPNTVDMPVGAGVPGCETNSMCYTPTHLTVHTGTTVTWINSDGSIPHTVTAGWPDGESIGLDYPGGNGFDSDFMSGGVEFEHTFNVPGEYDYYCQLHPWMIGSVTVE